MFNKIVLVLFFTFPLFGLEYTIRPQPNLLEVVLTFQGNASGITTIELPSSWAGKDELYLNLSEMQVVGATVQETDQIELRILSHQPNEMIRIRYLVSSREVEEVEHYYRPQVRESYFYFFGYCFFILPHIDEETVSLHWDTLSGDWTIANSFGVESAEQHIPKAKFQHAVYVGGDFRILSCGTSEAPIFVALRDEWTFAPERLTGLIETVMNSHRRFWNDFDFPYYLITLFSTGNSHHLGGTGLNYAFSLFINDLITEEDWDWLAWLLSHEHFHTWNGIKMQSAPPEGSLTWFVEGFTEYYAVKLLPGTPYLEKHIREIVSDYYNSPVRNEPNSRIQKDFWNSSDVQRLPYVRGYLFAAYWEKKMPLDKFMHALFARTKETKGVFSFEDIVEAATLFLPEAMVREDLQMFILEGQTLP